MSKATIKPQSFEAACRKAALEVAELVISKQHDYGPNNILMSPFGAEKGIVIRLYDKLARFANLLENNKTPRNETIDDTVKDIMGYGLVTKMVRDNTFTLPMKEKHSYETPTPRKR